MMALSKLRGSRSRLSQSATAATSYTVAGLLLVAELLCFQILFFNHETHAKPLVIPNKFSFQKTTSTSSTPLPSVGDHLNSSSSTFASSQGRKATTHPESHLYSNKSTSSAIRYDIAAWWVVGVVLGICFLILKFYPKTRSRRNDIDEASPSNYILPPNNSSNDGLKAAEQIS